MPTPNLALLDGVELDLFYYFLLLKVANPFVRRDSG